MTEPTTPAPKTRKKPGPAPKKARLAALELADIYAASEDGARQMIRAIVNASDLIEPPILRDVIDLSNDLDANAVTLTLNLFDIADKQTGM